MARKSRSDKKATPGGGGGRKEDGQASKKPPCPCPFLSCVAAVDDACWHEVLLPKLVEARSAASLALTCTRLRQLCHGSRTRLNLGPLAGAQPCEVEAFTSALHARFPHCTTAALSTPTDSSCLNVSALAPALSRLPHLVELELDAAQPDAGWPACRPATLALALDCMRRQLPRLRRLRLSLCTGRSAEDGSMPWRALAGATQLRELRLTVRASPPGALAMAHVCVLSALTQLQHLEVDADRVVMGTSNGGLLGSGGSASFPGALAQLTYLALPAPGAAGLAGLGGCLRLRHLALAAVDDAPLALDANSCGALGRLTRLTHLELGSSLLYTNTPHFHAALQRLTGLRFLGKPRLYPEMLPALGHLTALDTLAGAWRTAKRAAAQHQHQQPRAGAARCASVRRLLRTGGCVPFAAFPGLVGLSYRKELDVAALAALPPGLTALHVSEDDPLPVAARTLPGGASTSRRVAALRGLARLPDLAEADLCPGDNAELASLIGGCDRLARLRVWVGHGSGVSSHGLMQLAALRGLQELHITLLGLRLSKRAAQALLCALPHVRRLRLSVPYRYQYEMWLTTLSLLRARRLETPGSCEVDLIDGADDWDEDDSAEVVSDDGADEESDGDSSEAASGGSGSESAAEPSSSEEEEDDEDE